LLITVLILVTVGGGLVTIWYAYQMNQYFDEVIDRDLEAIRAAENLEISLAMQKGFVTYYYLDGNKEWLEKLDQYHQSFQNWMKRARASMLTEGEREILNSIESDYLQYTFLRDRVIHLYEEGKREQGAELHQQARQRFYDIIGLTEKFRTIHEGAISQIRADSGAQGRVLHIMAGAAICFVFLAGLALTYILIRQVLEPIRVLALDQHIPPFLGVVDNEVKVLRQKFNSLLEDVDATRERLEQSQESLAHSEKWAMVGKLAAGMAHSIRNPLTSLQMRLFSLGRTLSLNETQKEDFEVISEEIGHIDTIVANFLEFSRPPKFQMQKGSVSDVVDHALQLLRHRFDSAGVKVEKRRERRLSEIELDPEQMKEALVNLLLNSCEAMNEGGSIMVYEDEIGENGGARTAVLRITDTGPGIPESVIQKVFQPFFSTKGEGTGLGLSIVKRIIEGHGGMIDVDSTEGAGATFTITLPVAP